jgi:hypothetical protein
MQQTNDTKNVHIKVQCENEFRRFVLAEVTYANLAETLRSLLAFPPTTVFQLSYLDDEGDWVLFVTDSELLYACGITKSPLKIQVKICTGTTHTAPSSSISSTAVKFTVPVDEDDEEEARPWKGCRGRRGRGCGRGGAARGANMAERLDVKIARLIERHATLSAKLIEQDLPEEKARGLEWRISHLQNKIDAATLKKQQLANAASAVPKQQEGINNNNDPCVEGVATPTPFSDDCHEEEETGRWQTRGGGGRRGGCRRGRFSAAQEGEEQGEEGRRGGRGCGGPQAFACTTPEGKAAFEKLQACKEAVMAARRDKAGREAIMARIEELKVAKAHWREMKMALWKENRAAAAACPKKEAK